MNDDEKIAKNKQKRDTVPPRRQQSLTIEKLLDLPGIK